MESSKKLFFWQPFKTGIALIINNVRAFISPVLMYIPFGIAIAIFSLYLSDNFLNAVLSSSSVDISGLYSLVSSMTFPLIIMSLIFALFVFLFSAVAFNLATRGQALLDIAFELVVRNIGRIVLLFAALFFMGLLFLIMSAILFTFIGFFLTNVGVSYTVVYFVFIVGTGIFLALFGLLCSFSPFFILFKGYGVKKSILSSISCFVSNFWVLLGRFLLIGIFYFIISYLLETVIMLPLTRDVLSVFTDGMFSFKDVISTPLYLVLYSLANVLPAVLLLPVVSTLQVCIFMDVCFTPAGEDVGEDTDTLNNT